MPEATQIRGEQLESWAPPNPRLAPSVTEVHIWRGRLEFGKERLEQFQKSLDPDEQIRSESFRSAQDRRRFIVARGILRDILGRYLNRRPHELRFGYGPQRKPFLEFDTELHFNVSHSHELALYAVALDREVGIDLEWVEPHLAEREIAQRFFSRQDVAHLPAMPTAQRTRAFFEVWTRQEAYLKMRGDGLSDRQHSPPVDPLVSEGKSGWSWHPLAAGPNYAAAVVAQGTDWQPVLYEWQG